MHACWLILLLAWSAASALADTRLPRSTSPDGRVALFYRALPSEYFSRSYEFYFRDRKTLSPLSDQLAPGTNQIDDSEVLFQLIGRDAEAARTGSPRDEAFSYSVVWSPDSRRVVIEGGAHKYWSLEVYGRNGGFFKEEAFPSGGAFADYVRTHWPNLKFRRVGIQRRLRRRNGEFPDSPSSVCWLNDTTLAVNTYPYVFDEESYIKKLGDNSFFTLNFELEPKPAIVGFCR